VTFTKMLPDSGVIDANILIYAVNTDAPQHGASRRLLEAILDPAATLYVSPQILCEFYSVVTNPRRIAKPFDAAQATQMIDDLLELPGLYVLAVPPEAALRLTQLLKRNPVTGGASSICKSSPRCRPIVFSASTHSTALIFSSFLSCRFLALKKDARCRAAPHRSENCSIWFSCWWGTVTLRWRKSDVGLASAV
jgi:predicted nucleic acid-binding protein